LKHKELFQTGGDVEYDSWQNIVMFKNMNIVIFFCFIACKNNHFVAII